MKCWVMFRYAAPKRVKISKTSSQAPEAPKANAAEVEQKVKQWIRDNENPNTSAKYKSAWSQFVKWCEEERHEPNESTGVVVAEYCRHLLEDKNAASSTIAGACAAISDHLRYSEGQKSTNTEVVRRARKICQVKAKDKKPKKPLTVNMLVRMVNVCEYEEWMQVRDVFMILLLMSAYLRESELVALELNEVWVEELEVEGKPRQVLHVFVRKAKNDQERRGHQRLVGGHEGNLTLCPVTWFRRWMVCRNGLSGKNEFKCDAGSLVCKEDGSALATGTPCGIVQRWVDKIGMNGREYGSHSGRSGGATEANKYGVNDLLIKRHGNWKSDAVYDYIRESVPQQLQTTSFLQQ